MSRILPLLKKGYKEVYFSLVADIVKVSLGKLTSKPEKKVFGKYRNISTPILNQIGNISKKELVALSPTKNNPVKVRYATRYVIRHPYVQENTNHYTGRVQVKRDVIRIEGWLHSNYSNDLQDKINSISITSLSLVKGVPVHKSIKSKGKATALRQPYPIISESISTHSLIVKKPWFSNYGVGKVFDILNISNKHSTHGRGAIFRRRHNFYTDRTPFRYELRNIFVSGLHRKVWRWDYFVNEINSVVMFQSPIVISMTPFKREFDFLSQYSCNNLPNWYREKTRIQLFEKVFKSKYKHITYRNDYKHRKERVSKEYKKTRYSPFAYSTANKNKVLTLEPITPLTTRYTSGTGPDSYRKSKMSEIPIKFNDIISTSSLDFLGRAPSRRVRAEHKPKKYSRMNTSSVASTSSNKQRLVPLSGDAAVSKPSLNLPKVYPITGSSLSLNRNRVNTFLKSIPGTYGYRSSLSVSKLVVTNPYVFEYKNNAISLVPYHYPTSIGGTTDYTTKHVGWNSFFTKNRSKSVYRTATLQVSKTLRNPVWSNKPKAYSLGHYENLAEWHKGLELNVKSSNLVITTAKLAKAFFKPFGVKIAPSFTSLGKALSMGFLEKSSVTGMEGNSFVNSGSKFVTNHDAPLRSYRPFDYFNRVYFHKYLYSSNFWIGDARFIIFNGQTTYINPKKVLKPRFQYKGWQKNYLTNDGNSVLLLLRELQTKLSRLEPKYSRPKSAVPAVLSPKHIKQWVLALGSAKPLRTNLKYTPVYESPMNLPTQFQLDFFQYGIATKASKQITSLAIFEGYPYSSSDREVNHTLLMDEGYVERLEYQNFPFVSTKSHLVAPIYMEDYVRTSNLYPSNVSTEVRDKHIGGDSRNYLKAKGSFVPRESITFSYVNYNLQGVNHTSKYMKFDETATNTGLYQTISDKNIKMSYDYFKKDNVAFPTRSWGFLEVGSIVHTLARFNLHTLPETNHWAIKPLYDLPTESIHDSDFRGPDTELVVSETRSILKTKPSLGHLKKVNNKWVSKKKHRHTYNLKVATASLTSVLINTTPSRHIDKVGALINTLPQNTKGSVTPWTYSDYAKARKRHKASIRRHVMTYGKNRKNFRKRSPNVHTPRVPTWYDANDYYFSYWWSYTPGRRDDDTFWSRWLTKLKPTLSSFIKSLAPGVTYSTPAVRRSKIKSHRKVLRSTLTKLYRIGLAYEPEGSPDKSFQSSHKALVATKHPYEAYRYSLWKPFVPYFGNNRYDHDTKLVVKWMADNNIIYNSSKYRTYLSSLLSTSKLPSVSKVDTSKRDHRVFKQISLDGTQYLDYSSINTLRKSYKGGPKLGRKVKSTRATSKVSSDLFENSTKQGLYKESRKYNMITLTRAPSDKVTVPVATITLATGVKDNYWSRPKVTGSIPKLAVGSNVNYDCEVNSFEHTSIEGYPPHLFLTLHYRLADLVTYTKLAKTNVSVPSLTPRRSKSAFKGKRSYSRGCRFVDIRKIKKWYAKLSKSFPLNSMVPFYESAKQEQFVNPFLSVGSLSAITQSNLTVSYENAHVPVDISSQLSIPLDNDQDIKVAKIVSGVYNIDKLKGSRMHLPNYIVVDPSTSVKPVRNTEHTNPSGSFVTLLGGLNGEREFTDALSIIEPVSLTPNASFRWQDWSAGVSMGHNSGSLGVFGIDTTFSIFYALRKSSHHVILSDTFHQKVEWKHNKKVNREFWKVYLTSNKKANQRFYFDNWLYIYQHRRMKGGSRLHEWVLTEASGLIWPLLSINSIQGLRDIPLFSVVDSRRVIRWLGSYLHSAEYTPLCVLSAMVSDPVNTVTTNLTLELYQKFLDKRFLESKEALYVPFVLSEAKGMNDAGFVQYLDRSFKMLIPSVKDVLKLASKIQKGGEPTSYELDRLSLYILECKTKLEDPRCKKVLLLLSRFNDGSNDTYTSRKL